MAHLNVFGRHVFLYVCLRALQRFLPFFPLLMSLSLPLFFLSFFFCVQAAFQHNQKRPPIVRFSASTCPRVEASLVTLSLVVAFTPFFFFVVVFLLTLCR